MNEHYVATLEWTTERLDELEQLENLLNYINSLESGSGFLGKIQAAMEIAKKLTERRRDGSFLRWLKESWEKQSRAG